MVTLKDIIPISLSSTHAARCLYHAGKCSLGGISHVRSDGGDRRGFLLQDQLVGQLGTCAATMWLSDDGEEGFRLYDSIRSRQNENPYHGDGGDDIPPYRIDVKGSGVHNFSKSVLSYNLLVRPAERHEGWVYLFCLVDNPRVALVGWAYDEDFPKEVESGGIFSGAYRISAGDLRCMKELRSIYMSRAS